MADGRKSDLGIRTASAVVMLAVAGGALWAGGRVLDAFIVAVALACFAELARLVLKAWPGALARTVGIVAGAAYLGLAGAVLIDIGNEFLLEIVLGVIATDIGAYFAGRTIGGPKIAPAISPSKTWAGLAGGAVLASLVLAAEAWLSAGVGPGMIRDVRAAAIFGVILAVVAQAGDFLESWLKRRAGVKDSSRLIPGHGGVFDRVDGLVAVACLVGLWLGISLPLDVW